jgi:diguanylate cyclase (GGDEF)-like protein
MLAVCGVGIVGFGDYVTGYEVSMSLFYMGPIAVAAWYAGRTAGVAIAVLSCVGWYIADIAAGNEYSNPLIAVWNVLVRLGFFLITSLLLTALRESLLKERHLAQRDGLTGLYGRRAFEERLEHDIALAQRASSPVTIVYLDLDDFKAVNDTYGHVEGDRVLRTVGAALDKSIRHADTAGRLGGDEFALVLPDTDDYGAQRVISNLTRQIHEAVTAGRSPVTCSIGVVTFFCPPVSARSILAAADALMYEVKRNGKSAIAYKVLREAAQSPAAAGRSNTARG